MMTTQERAVKGAQFLDERMPGWHKKIDTEKLDQSKNYDCILGQLYSIYWKGLVANNLSANESRELGFIYFPDDETWQAPHEYKELTAAWKVEITMRKVVYQHSKQEELVEA